MFQYIVQFKTDFYTSLRHERWYNKWIIQTKILCMYNVPLKNILYIPTSSKVTYQTNISYYNCVQICGSI
jgi:hypothetical protein